MKSTIINTSDLHGGAAKASYRVHQALISSGTTSSMLVINKASTDPSVIIYESKLDRFLNRLKNALVSRIIKKIFNTQNPILHSPAIFPSHLVNKINESDSDLIHLEWINNEMLSVKDISRIQKPMLWTLHDMWAFCGAEHYTTDLRWKEGYSHSNRPEHESGFDLNMWTWKRKLKLWKKPIHIVTSSNWLAECVKQSALMKSWPVTVIPNAIDTRTWKALDKKSARQQLKLPSQVPLLLFGAMGGAEDPRKGFDLLQSALKALQGKIPGLELVIFGQSAPKVALDLGFPIHYTGHLSDDASLNVLYSAADALVIPSRQDNLPNTAVEALASGTPLIAFNEGGLPDLINHKSNGYLAKAFDILDLASGIQWMFSDQAQLKKLAEQARIDAVEKYSSEVIAAKYKQLYQQILS